jgi:hypothetical protein
VTLSAKSRADYEAHNLVLRAVKRGILTPRETCEECGSAGKRRRDGGSGIEAHHDDYNHPLRVRWLCKSCHVRWHRANVAVERDPHADPLDALLADLDDDLLLAAL